MESKIISSLKEYSVDHPIVKTGKVVDVIGFSQIKEGDTSAFFIDFTKDNSKGTFRVTLALYLRLTEGVAALKAFDIKLLVSDDFTKPLGYISNTTVKVKSGNKVSGKIAVGSNRIPNNI